MRRTGSRRWARRTMGLLGKGGGAALLLAGVSAQSPVLAVVLISLASFTSDLALASMWAVCTDAGGRFVGTVFGVMNTVAAVGAALSPLLAGYLLNWLSPRPVGDPTPASLWALCPDAGGRVAGVMVGALNSAASAVTRAGAWDVLLYVYAATLALAALCWLRIDADESMVG
jgi:hypothetical protein